MRPRNLFPLLWLLASATLGADWPAFQGIDRTGLARETGLARTWPTNGPPVLWTRAVGKGYGAAAVRAQRVYMLDYLGEKEEALVCLDLHTGKELWRYPFAMDRDFPYPGSRTVPTVEDKHAYIQSANGQLQCVDLQSHQPVWSRNVITDFRDHRLPRALQIHPPKWGFTQHPTIAGDKLIVAPYSLTAGVVALDKLTGKQLWRSADIGQNTYCHVTPYIATLGGVPQVVTVDNSDAGRDPPATITGIELATGRTLWQLETWHRYNVPIPQPVQVSSNRLFVTGGYTVGGFLLEVTPSTQSNILWTVDYVWRDNQLITSHIHNPLFYGGHLYAQSYDKFHQTKHNGLTCLDLAGNLKWKTGPQIIFGNGHLLIADGLIFVMNDPAGELVMAEAKPDGYKELGRAKVLTGRDRNIWAPMALADGRLIVRDQYEMKCLDLRRPPLTAGD